MVTNYSTGATSCVATGNTPANYACTGSGSGQCQAGYTCVDGNCSLMCDPSGAACPDQYSECGGISSGGNPIPGLYTCTHTCNPVSPGTSSGPYGACGPNINCFPSTSGASGCLGPTGSGTQGGYCDDPNYNPDQTQCAAGYVCLNDGLFNDCYQFCRVGMNDCPPLYTCYSFVNPEYAGPTEIGYCY
jgi:hypothetical protein